MKDKKFQSRRATSWDNYDKRHIAPGDEREVSLLNLFAPSPCPKCGSGSIIKYGKTGAGLHRYKCRDCSGTFTVITGTIFDQRKISISQWLKNGNDHRPRKLQPHLEDKKKCFYYHEILDGQAVPDSGGLIGVHNAGRRHIS